VNNAGVMVFGPVEEVPLDAAHGLFETNFWGVARMVNAALPVMRRQGRGHIVNVGSVAGTTAIPLNGFYAATKHALAGYTEALRYEVSGFGVRVALVEPGDVKSNLWGGPAITPPRFDAYGSLRESVLASVNEALAHAPEPPPVAEAIVRIAENDAPRLHNPVGTWARALPRMKAWMPDWMFERGVRRRFARGA
jgi:short-subunit dehydrogenase